MAFTIINWDNGTYSLTHSKLLFCLFTKIWNTWKSLAIVEAQEELLGAIVFITKFIKCLSFLCHHIYGIINFPNHSSEPYLKSGSEKDTNFTHQNAKSQQLTVLRIECLDMLFGTIRIYKSNLNGFLHFRNKQKSKIKWSKHKTANFHWDFIDVNT